jgi:hypothetical protein
VGFNWESEGVQAAGQKELLRYGATADTVKPGSTQHRAALRPCRDEGSTRFATHSSHWTQVRTSNGSNCGERLEAQGGTLLASHGPDLT